MPYWTPGSTGALPLTRALGVWNTGLPIERGEMQDLDQKSAAAVNRNGDTVAGDFTWSGAHVFSGSARIKQLTSPVPAVNSTISSATAGVWRCSTPLASLEHTVSNAAAEGYQVTVWRGSAGGFDIVLRRDDATLIATLPSGTQSAVTLTYYTADGWQVTSGYAFT